jgi:thiol-disulfide isomerase/thioredoxin
MNRRHVVVGLLFVALIMLRMYLVGPMGYLEGFQDKAETKVVIAKADWCGHCRKAAPEFNRLKEASPIQLADGRSAVVEILDADQNKAEVEALGVKGFPTIMVMKGGEKQEYPGERTYDAVVAFLNQA